MTTQNNPPKFTLGQRVRCIVTAFEGIAITRVEWLNGCTQYLVKPLCVQKADEALKMPDGNYIDDNQLELVDEGILDPRVQQGIALSQDAVGVDPASGPDMVGGRVATGDKPATGGPSHREGELPT